MNLKLVIGVLASSIVPLITYIVSTIIAHVQLNKLLKRDPDPYDDYDYTHKDELRRLALYFTSSYVTFTVFIGFLAVVILAALNILKNNLLIIILTLFDGAVMVTAGAGLLGSMYVIVYKGAGVGMFVGAAVLILVKIFPILPLTFELLTKGISANTGNEDSMLRRYLPFAIYGALALGFIASVVYTEAALVVTIKSYAETDEGYYECNHDQFLYSLPLFMFLQMTVAMVLFVQFKWKWGVRTFAVLSSLLLVLLGYALNMMTLDLYYYYYYTDAYQYDFDKVQHRGNISMTFASVIMILITIFVNMAWPVLYNLRDPTENGETNIAVPVPYNPIGNEETKPLLS